VGNLEGTEGRGGTSSNSVRNISIAKTTRTTLRKIQSARWGDTDRFQRFDEQREAGLPRETVVRSGDALNHSPRVRGGKPGTSL